MGVSRDIFYCYCELVSGSGVNALIDHNYHAPNLKNRTGETAEQTIVDYAVTSPAHGRHWTNDGLRKQDVSISSSSVCPVWLHHSSGNFKERLKALEGKVACNSIELADGQIAALEHKVNNNEAYGEIKTVRPGYLGLQDTFYVGSLKDVA